MVMAEKSSLAWQQPWSLEKLQWSLQCVRGSKGLVRLRIWFAGCSYPALCSVLRHESLSIHLQPMNNLHVQRSIITYRAPCEAKKQTWVLLSCCSGCTSVPSVHCGMENNTFGQNNNRKQQDLCLPVVF